MRIPQLSHSDQNVLDQLFAQWQSKLPRNALRSVYFDMKQPLKDLGISVPPQLANLDTTLGWPAKGVRALSRRCIFDSFAAPGIDGDPFDISSILIPNEMDSAIPQGIESSQVHAVSFITTTAGDVQSGEPEVLQSIRSARWGTGLWDKRRRAFSAFLSIIAMGDTDPTQFIMYLPDRILDFEKVGTDKWRVFEQRNTLGRVPVRRLAYRADLDRPMGHSRITRAGMTITDQAMRVLLRTEVSAEFFSAPQRYLLGADTDAFTGDNLKATMWNAVIGRILAIGRDEQTDQVPTVGQFAQHSMDPHHSHYRNLAASFANEMDLAPASMGIVSDSNPASADAYYAAKEELILEAENATREYGNSLTKSAIDGLMIREGLSTPTAEMLTMSARFRDPSTPSRAAASDAVTKQVGVFPWMADSDVPLEQLGYDDATIARLRADRRRSQVATALAGIGDRARAAAADPELVAVVGARE